MATPVSAKVERVQDGVVFVTTSDGQSLHIPETAIQGAAQAGTELRLFFLPSSLEGTTDTSIAHSILNELLGTNA